MHDVQMHIILWKWNVYQDLEKKLYASIKQNTYAMYVLDFVLQSPILHINIYKYIFCGIISQPGIILSNSTLKQKWTLKRKVL